MIPEPFVKLADPSTYVACDWNLCADPEGRQYWTAFFKRHLVTMLKLGVESSNAPPAAPDRAAACQQEFNAFFDAFAADPARFDCVTILTLDAWRDDFLKKYGF